MKKEIIDAVKGRDKSEKFIETIRFRGKVIHAYLDTFGKIKIRASNHSNSEEISEKELIDFKEWLDSLGLNAEAQHKKQ